MKYYIIIGIILQEYDIGRTKARSYHVYPQQLDAAKSLLFPITFSARAVDKFYKDILNKFLFCGKHLAVISLHLSWLNIY
jgi:hypothetical protein